MKMRWLTIPFAVFVVVVIGAAVWMSLPVSHTQSLLDDVPAGTAPAGPLTDEQFEQLARTDVIAALQASIRAYGEAADGGFTAEFHKHERMGGKLADEEVIDVAVKDDPHSVLMLWKQGGGPGRGTVYVSGKNDGQMKVWMLRTFVKSVDPQGVIPKQSARYTIEEFGIRQSTKRTLRAWAAAKEADQLQVEYLGRRVVPETGGRECFVLKRTCPADQIDPFVTGGEAVTVTDKNRADSFRTVTVYLDCETRLQVGTEQHRHDGELTASYWFRNVNLKPAFDDDTFTTKSFR